MDLKRAGDQMTGEIEMAVGIAGQVDSAADELIGTRSARKNHGLESQAMDYNMGNGDGRL